MMIPPANPKHAIYPGIDALVAGWSIVNPIIEQDDQQVSHHLVMIEVTLINNFACQYSYNHQIYNNIQICASPKNYKTNLSAVSKQIKFLVQ